MTHSHRFDKILKIVKKIRQIKSDTNNGHTIINLAFIYLRNNEIDLYMTLKSIRTICTLTKSKSMIVVYFDENIKENGIILYYNLSKEKLYISELIPSINFGNLSNKEDFNRFYNLISSHKFITVDKL